MILIQLCLFMFHLFRNDCSESPPRERVQGSEQRSGNSADQSRFPEDR